MPAKEREYASLRLCKECHREIARIAGQERVTMAQVVEKAIAAYVVIRDLNENLPKRPRLEVRA